MSSGEQGAYKDLVNFFNSSRIFLINCQKPDRKGNLILFTLLFLTNINIFKNSLKLSEHVP